MEYFLHQSHSEFLFAKNNFVLDNSLSLFQKKTNVERKVKKIASFNPNIFIITSSCNRLNNLSKLYQSISAQKFHGKVAWIIIDNGSDEKTTNQLDLWEAKEKWLICLSYKTPFGYATPARNKGLLLVSWILKFCSGTKFYWVIDSDDYIHNEYVLQELFVLANKSKSMMTHGYTVTNHMSRDGLIEFNSTIPRNLSSSFPSVPNLRDEFDLGPQNLAAIIDCESLYDFTYPDEFTMEDDTLNQKIMLWSLKKMKKIVSYEFPCLVKSFHENSMSNKNNKIGDSSISVPLGPTIVKGIRAQVVLGILMFRDYFTREKL